MCAIEAGKSVYFTQMAKMTHELGHSPSARILSKYLKPKLLILDEIGYRNVDPRAGALFFDVISERYERSSIIVTSNKSFGDWGDLFGKTMGQIWPRLLESAPWQLSEPARIRFFLTDQGFFRKRELLFQEKWPMTLSRRLLSNPPSGMGTRHLCSQLVVPVKCLQQQGG